jgi:hypothetical protein
LRKLLLLLVLFSLNATAADYYWRAIEGGTSGDGATPTAAYLAFCNKSAGYLALGMCTNPSQYTLTKLTDTSWKATTRFANGSINSYVNVTRYGTTCPPNTTFDAATGECKGDPCLATAGQTIGNRVGMGVISSTGNTISKTDPPGSVCQNSCQYAWNGTHAQKVYRFIEGSDNTIYGDYLYVGNGVTCSATDTPPAPRPVTATSPIRNKDASCGASVVDPQGGGVSSQCTSTDEYRDPGALSCGQMNGEWLCTVGTPSPKAAKKTVTVDTNTVTNPDGSKTTTKSTVTVVKDCSGLKGCRDTTTGKIETTGTNADGTPGTSTTTGSCTGPNCGLAGGDGNGEGDSGGDDLTDEEIADRCDPSTDPSQCGSKSVAGIDCEAALACTGDAIGCALLRTQKEQHCAAEIAGDYTANASNIDTLFAGPEFEEPEESIVDLSAIFNTGTRFLPSACPADMAIPIGTFGRSITLRWGPMCTLAEVMSYIIVAMAGLFFVRYVGGSQ